MKKTRIALVVLALFSIGSVICLGAFSKSVQNGTMAKDWMGVFGLMMTGAVIANVVLSFIYAHGTGRQGILWAIGSFLFPYIIPFLLAFLPDYKGGLEIQSGGASGTEIPSDNVLNEKIKPIDDAPTAFFQNIPKSSPEINSKNGVSRSSKLRLDRLRIFCIILPGSFKWYGVGSSQSLNFLFPDLMSSQEANAIYMILEKASLGGNKNDLYGIKVCIAGYDNESTIIDLHKIREKSVDLLAGLYHFRNERSEKLKEWLDGKPRVTLRGGLGAQAVLDRDGFHKKKLSVGWKEVGKINTETVNGLITHLYVLPKGMSGGLFDIGKGKYALGNISTRRKELYSAECFFWKTYCG